MEASGLDMSRSAAGALAPCPPVPIDLHVRSSTLKTIAVVASIVIFPIGLVWAGVSAYQRHVQYHAISSAIARSLAPSGDFKGIDLAQVDKITNIAIALLSSSVPQVVIKNENPVTLSSGCGLVCYETAPFRLMVKLSDSRVIIVPNASIGAGCTKEVFPAVEVTASGTSQEVIAFPLNQENKTLSCFLSSIKESQDKAAMVKRIAQKYNVTRCFQGADEEIKVGGQSFFINKRCNSDLDKISSLMTKSQLVSDYPRIVLFAMIETLAGLIALFKEGVVHSDIKPENILVDYFGGKSLEVRITDYESVTSIESKKMSVRTEKVWIASQCFIEPLIERLRPVAGFSALLKGTPLGDDYYPSKKEYFSFVRSTGRMSEARYSEIKRAFKERREEELTPLDDFDGFMIFLFKLDDSLISGTEDHISPKYARQRFPEIESDMYALGETLSRLITDMDLKYVSLSGVSSNERLREIAANLKSSHYTTVGEAEQLLLELQEMLQSHLRGGVSQIKTSSSFADLRSVS